MLMKSVDSVKGYNYRVIDDGSDFKLENNFIQFTHMGKQWWYQTWQIVLTMVDGLMPSPELIVFTADDFLDLDVKRIFELHERYKAHPYFYNIIKDRRDFNWGRIPVLDIDEDTEQVGFVDCGFFCNFSALEKIGFWMNPVDQDRFKNKRISSGVGIQLTQRIRHANIPMYRPKKSLAYHGNHPSVMHPTLRKINPIISL